MSSGKVSMPSAMMICTVCSLAIRSIAFQSTFSLNRFTSAFVPQSPALRSSRNCCCALVISISSKLASKIVNFIYLLGSKMIYTFPTQTYQSLENCVIKIRKIGILRKQNADFLHSRYCISKTFREHLHASHIWTFHGGSGCRYKVRMAEAAGDLIRFAGERHAHSAHLDAQGI